MAIPQGTAGPDAAEPGQESAPSLPGAGGGEAGALRRRRMLVLALNLATFLALMAGMAAILAHGGFVAVDWAMLAAFAVTLPWTTIGLWNAVIGLALDLRHGAGAAAQVTPALARVRADAPIRGRVAVLMPLRNEDPGPALARFAEVQAALGRTPWAERFDFHVLSDTDRPEVALREEALVARWRQAAPGAVIGYRRRPNNEGYKAGNIAQFLADHRDEYAFVLPLDADSTMGAGTILRMVRTMEAAPEIGILQSLVTGLPSKTFFTRAFQFGMRHGMRSYTLGSAWWQGDCGPNWGHNVLIRAEPFRAHCMLPLLPGRGPLAGHILSHDQVEAVLMRRAGWEVRVIAEESESHEENPPSLVDFIGRDIRWCNGNMQYFGLLGMPGLRPLSRVQLWLAIQMYLAAPAWLLFILLGAVVAAMPDQVADVPLPWGLGFFAVLMGFVMAPKLMGLAQVLARDDRAARYGGRWRVALGGIAEIAVSMLVAPAVAFAVTRFMLGLPFGRRVGWDAQQRSRARLDWDEAARALWPQTLAGWALALWLWTQAPWALAFGAPVLLSLALAIPLAVLSTSPPVGLWSRRAGLFDIPEDRAALPSAAGAAPATTTA